MTMGEKLPYACGGIVVAGALYLILALIIKLAGVEQANIVKLARELFDDEDAYAKMAHAVNPYGDGKTSERIVQAIEQYFGLREEDCGCGRYRARAVGGAQLCAVLRLDARQQHRHYPARQ